MNLIGHYEKGISNKAYIVSVVPELGRFKVVVKWGGIGKHVSSQIKSYFNFWESARDEANRLFGIKIKKGYEDILSPNYTGGLSHNDSWLKSHIEDCTSNSSDPVDAPKLATSLSPVYDRVKEKSKKGQRIEAIKIVRATLECGLADGKARVKEIEDEISLEEEAKRDFEVVCLNSLGMEDSFDEGIEYVAERHADKNMIYVWDRAAKKQECFKDRFKTVTVMISKTSNFRFKPITGKN